MPNQLADMHGWMCDLMSAKVFFDRARAQLESAQPDTDALDAFCVAAIVRYARCFGSGNRERLRIEHLPAATSDDLRIHAYLRGTRDWHVAHPINEQEVHAVYLIVDENAKSGPSVAGISSQSSATLGMQLDDIDAAIVLCWKWIEHVSAQTTSEEAKLRPYIQSLTHIEVLALPVSELQPNPRITARRRQSRS